VCSDKVHGGYESTDHTRTPRSRCVVHEKGRSGQIYEQEGISPGILYQFKMLLIYVNLRKNHLTGTVINVKRSGKKPTCADVIHRLEDSVIRPP